MTADARLQRWLGQWGRAVLSKLGPPEIALDSITIRTGQCNTWVAGESVPRQFEQVDCKLTLGRDCQDLDLKLSGLLHRDHTTSACLLFAWFAAGTVGLNTSPVATSNKAATAFSQRS